ncbi:hypothetical protein [Mariluticola halotolerans]|uniref:hypothetical protein n=1 Tax=Mariluticola halotolerans TaxID=2909283 RepID=UPI0026E3534F|nr:hypothetical protein [Mariluticola halotolerans]UJQ94597.1 hypothetical protein L1P08_00970 [Mariluticola halotolerans]
MSADIKRNIAVDGDIVHVSFSNADQKLDLALTPEELMGLTLELTVAMQTALQNEDRDLSIPENQRPSIAGGSWSFEVKGAADGRASLVITPQNYYRFEYELSRDFARHLAQSLLTAAEHMGTRVSKH